MFKSKTTARFLRHPLVVNDRENKRRECLQIIKLIHPHQTTHISSDDPEACKGQTESREQRGSK